MFWVALPITFVLLAADPLQPIEEMLARQQFKEVLAALDRQPQSARKHLLASKAYDALNRPAEAVSEAEKALSIDSKNEAAYLQLGQIFLSRNTPQAALEIYQEALDLFPQSILLRLGKGLALKELKRYDDAAKELRQCLIRQPSSGIIFDALATSLIHGLLFDEAAKISNQFITVNPDDFRGYYFSAAARDGLRLDDPESIRLLRESIRRNANFAASLALAGKILLRQNEVQEAVSLLERSTKLRPDYAPAHLALVKGYRILGRESDVEREVQIIRQLNEQDREPRQSLRYHRGILK